jgi:hypothetical protein
MGELAEKVVAAIRLVPMVKVQRGGGAFDLKQEPIADLRA